MAVEARGRPSPQKIVFYLILMLLLSALLLLIIISTIIFKSSWFKGKFGEWFVAQILKFRLPKNEYQVIHNVTLPTEDGYTTQIDHIILSEYGIFVLETKNMKGWIFGSENDKTWTQKIFKVTNTFQNPLRQNYKHTKTLANLLNIDEKLIFSVVVFIGDSTFKTQMPENVVYGGKVINYILSKKVIILSHTEIAEIKNMILSKMLTRSLETDIVHIKNVKEIVASKQISPQHSPKSFSNLSLTDWLLFILSIIYTISPIDLIPDAPVVGWFDDATLLMSSGLNMVQKYLGDSHILVYKALKLLKWGILILGIIVVLLALILIANLVRG